jgi:RNA polymerase sigma factor (sigma-70 family)
MDDMELLRQYAETGSEEAFETLVTRHINWVYSMCLRGVRDRHLADDATQAVFILLARKAGTMAEGTILRGWLFKTSRFVVADALKKRSRCRRHEERAAALAHMDMLNSRQEESWERLAPSLDEAVGCLSDKDRQAVLLRFYEGKSLAEVGTILEISEEAAKKRVARAVLRLRAYFAREGTLVPALVLAGLLLAQTSHAAPAGLAASACSSAVGASVASGMAQALAVGARQGILRATGRLLAAIAGGALIPCVGLLIVRSIISGGQTAVTVPQPPAVAELNPSVDHIEKMWIGSKEKIYWQFPPSEQASVKTPVLLESPEPKLFAVAKDSEGAVWIRRLSRESLDPAGTQEFDDPPPGRRLPMAPPSTEEMLVRLLSEEPLNSARRWEPGPMGNYTISAETGWRSFQPDPLGDYLWHLASPLVKDGTLVAEETPLPNLPANLMFLLPSSVPQFKFNTNVPEPGLTILAVLGVAMMSRRRRR